MHVVAEVLLLFSAGLKQFVPEIEVIKRSHTGLSDSGVSESRSKTGRD